MANISKSDLLIEQLAREMPPDCLNLFKRFSLCQWKTEQAKEVSEAEKEQSYSTEGFSRVLGCKNEYLNFNRCMDEFVFELHELRKIDAEANNVPAFKVQQPERPFKFF